MKYASLDLETTCLEDRSPKNILMVSIVVEDPKNPMPLKELPHFTAFVRYPTVSGEAYALAMNAWILDIISGRKPNETGYEIYNQGDWIKPANDFLTKHFGDQDGRIFCAGKNVGTFDFGFLPDALRKRFSFRVIDPAMKFTDLLNDDKIANLETCKKRAGLEPVVSHDAREDALDVIATLRPTYGKVY